MQEGPTRGVVKGGLYASWFMGFGHQTEPPGDVHSLRAWDCPLYLEATIPVVLVSHPGLVRQGCVCLSAAHLHHLFCFPRSWIPGRPQTHTHTAYRNNALNSCWVPWQGHVTRGHSSMCVFLCVSVCVSTYVHAHTEPFVCLCLGVCVCVCDAMQLLAAGFPLGCSSCHHSLMITNCRMYTTQPSASLCYSKIPHLPNRCIL